VHNTSVVEMNGCEYMKCEEFYNGVCNYETGYCKFNPPNEESDRLESENAALRAQLENANELFIHYGYVHGSVPQRVDSLCAALVDNMEVVKNLMTENSALRERVKELEALCREAAEDIQDIMTEIEALRQTCADAYVMFAPKAEDADETAMLDRLAKAANGEKE